VFVSTDARLALYLAPAEGSRLETLAAAWLGRDLTGAEVERPALARSINDWAALTESPRHYGFHGTLKPPFALAEGRSEAELEGMAETLARDRAPFVAPPLEVAVLGSFLALRPTAPAPDLNALAAACVMEMDAFRAPQSEAELDKRRGQGLTPGQEAMLVRWGYPYVLDEFRFHMTLTGPIPDPARREALRDALAAYFAPALDAPLAVGEIALYRQPDRLAPFVLIRRLPLTG
jgi:putative phosphonate metabolism protein